VPGGSGDIRLGDSLQLIARTFGAGVGVDDAFLAQNIDGGSGRAALA
jgi:hypothetical protein